MSNGSLRRTLHAVKIPNVKSWETYTMKLYCDEFITQLAVSGTKLSFCLHNSSLFYRVFKTPGAVKEETARCNYLRYRNLQEWSHAYFGLKTKLYRC